jgi:hypothetical protein
MSTLLDRLRAKMGPPIDLGYRTPCRLWLGAISRSGRRKTCYPIIKSSTASAGAPLRVNRLLLILRDGPTDCPRDPGEPFEDWLRRVNHTQRHMDAAHLCDRSMCCEETHLEWQDHPTNVRDQAQRRQESPTHDKSHIETISRSGTFAPP